MMPNRAGGPLQAVFAWFVLALFGDGCQYLILCRLACKKRLCDIEVNVLARTGSQSNPLYNASCKETCHALH